jgi:hypothetical protein
MSRCNTNTTNSSSLSKPSPFRIGSLNCRSLTTPPKPEISAEFIHYLRKLKYDILCLQETRKTKHGGYSKHPVPIHFNMLIKTLWYCSSEPKFRITPSFYHSRPTTHCLSSQSCAQFVFYPLDHGPGLWRINPQLTSNPHFTEALTIALDSFHLSLPQMNPTLTIQEQWDQLKTIVKDVALQCSRRKSEWRMEKAAFNTLAT